MSKQNPKPNWMSGAKATVAKAAATVAVRRKKESDQLNTELVGESPAPNNALPALDAGSERTDTRDYKMPLPRNNAAPERLAQSANTKNLPPTPQHNVNNTPSHGVRIADPNNQFRRINSGDNTDDLHSIEGNEGPRPKNQVVNAQEARFDPHDRKPVKDIIINSQAIRPVEELFVDCLDDYRDDHKTGTEEGEESVKGLLEPATLSLQNNVLEGEYATLKQEKEVLESKCATLGQEKKASERKITNLEANQIFFQGECSRLRSESESLGQDKQRLENDIQIRREREETSSVKYQELLMQNMNLDRDRDHWMAQHTSLSDAHKQEKSRATALEVALETRRKELEQNKLSNTRLMENQARTERRNVELENSLRNVNGQLTTFQEESKKWKNQNKRLAAQLSGYTFEGSVYSADAYFQQEWRNLDAMIVNWSHHIFRDNSDSFIDAILKKPPKLPRGHILRRVATDPYRYLTNSTRRPAFTQGFVWSILVEQVFTPPGGYGDSDLCGLYWSGPLRGELDTICGYLHPDITIKKDPKVMEREMRNYMRWKSSTTQLVLGKINEDPDKEPLIYDELINVLADSIFDCLKPFVASKDNDSNLRNLGDVLRSAMKLDGKINRQLARRVPQYTWTGSKTRFFHSFPFDSRIMSLPPGEHEPSSDAKAKAPSQVQMVLTPALVRYGSIEGEKYENFQNPDVVLHAVVHLQSSSSFPSARLKKEHPANNPGGGQLSNGEINSSRSSEYNSDNRGVGRSGR